MNYIFTGSVAKCIQTVSFAEGSKPINRPTLNLIRQTKKHNDPDIPINSFTAALWECDY